MTSAVKKLAITFISVTASVTVTGCFFGGGGGDPMRARAKEMGAQLESKEAPINAPPVVEFPEGQAALDSTSRDWVANGGGRLLRAYVTNPAWGTGANEREVWSVFYYRGGGAAGQAGNYPDHCYRRRAIVREYARNGGWQPPFITPEASFVRVNCEQVDALPRASS